MPAKRPAYVTGPFYDIHNRGAHQASIFREDDNCLFVLRKMQACCR